MNICYVFGAVNYQSEINKTDNSDYLIAADAGYSLMKNHHIIPDVIIGDFDSLSDIPDNKDLIRHPVRKDDTDLMLAVKYGFSKGYNKFIIYGCLGGRIDQTFATIQTANYITENGGKVICVSDNECITVVKNGEISFKEKKNGIISVFSLTDTSEGVFLNNLSYPLLNAKITSSFPLGVSNEFTGEKSSVKAESGTLLVIWNGTPDDLIDF